MRYPKALHRMTDYQKKKAYIIGHELLRHAESSGKARLPLTTWLFPYIYIASRRMTASDVSDWLMKTFGITLSAPMITKGLRAPRSHLKRIAEFVLPLAEYLAALTGYSVEDLLYYSDKDGITVAQTIMNSQGIQPNPGEQRVSYPYQVWGALDTFVEIWDRIPDEVKHMCSPYFDDLRKLNEESEIQTADDSQTDSHINEK